MGKEDIKEKVWSFLKTYGPMFLSFVFKKRYLQTFYACVIALLTGLGFNVKFNCSGIIYGEITYGEVASWLIAFAIVVGLVAFLAQLLYDWHKDNQTHDENIKKIELEKDKISKRTYPIQQISQFISNHDTRGAFILAGNAKVKSLIDKIKESNGPEIRILAFSGMGKTRWVYEAFKDTALNDKVYYCEDPSSIEFKPALRLLIQDLNGHEAVLVLDDCPQSAVDEAKNILLSTKNNVRLITLSSDLKEVGQNTNCIKFEYEDLQDITREIIDSRLLGKEKQKFKEQLINLAESIPYMAVMLVDLINKTGDLDVNIPNKSVLCRRMLHFDGQYEEEKMRIIRSLSLFHQLGYEQEDEGDFAFVVNNENITPFNNVSINRKNLFREVVNEGKKLKVIEQRSNFISVRPQTLAIWLLEGWFNDCDANRFMAIKADIDKLEPFMSHRLIEAICRRLTYMNSESARKLVETITGDNTGFRNEKVVCSDMGSRLFLAMCTVNPVAVTECLDSVLSNKSIQWLQINIADKVRRNYVWTLEKLCFPSETFNKAALLMARLALAENEDWGNNATGQFVQLFHASLAGTSVDLVNRFSLIKELKTKGEEYKSLVLLAIDSSLNSRHFYRMNGAENFGFNSLEDYSPTINDVILYWRSIYNFVEDLVKEDKSIVDSLAPIIVKHIKDLGRIYECDDIIFKYIDLISSFKENGWPEMAKELTLAYNRRGKNDQTGRIRSYIEKLTPSDFVSRLYNAHMEYYASYNVKMEELWAKAEPFFQKFADEFKEKALYNDTMTVRQLMDETNHVDNTFINLLSRILDESQTAALLDSILQVLQENGECNHSSFALSFGRLCKQSLSLDKFLDTLYKRGCYGIYTEIISEREKEDLSSLKIILSRFSNMTEMVEDILSIYVRRSTLNSAKQMYNACEMIKQNIPSKSTRIVMSYIVSRQYSDIILSEDMKAVTLKTLVDFQEQKHEQLSYEAVMIAERLLEKYSLPEFAKDYNDKIIKRAGSEFVMDKYKHIYSALLPKYQDIILGDVMNALSDNDSGYFTSLYLELGSGFGFGSGPLFQCKQETIKTWCLEKSDTRLPVRLAMMAPVFKYTVDDKKEGFSDFIIWLLDNLNCFTEAEDILDGIKNNMDSFSWIGSVIPLLKDKRKCFENILQHPNHTVADWATKCITSIDSEIRLEERKEAYESF